MPALQTTQPSRSHDAFKSLSHVNLMVDTFIANVHADDLRAIVRGLLATGSPSMVSAITSAARARLLHTHFKSRPCSHALFIRGTSDDTIAPTPHLTDTLAYARTLFGAGMGFASLRVLASVVRASIGLRWEPDSKMADALALVDADICQALQSSREELESGSNIDLSKASEAITEIRSAINESFEDVRVWGGEVPWERASACVNCWKI